MSQTASQATRYISLLRGINVSGQKKIKMVDLCALYEGLGFENIRTYIQSGNVLFDSSNTDQAQIKAQIEQAIEAKYQFSVPVDLRTKSEFQRLVDNCPFEEAQLAENGAKIMVVFLRERPDAERITEVVEMVRLPEKLVHQGRQVLIYCPNGYGRCRFSNTFLESQLGVGATTRNWRSVMKLLELCD